MIRRGTREIALERTTTRAYGLPPGFVPDRVDEHLPQVGEKGALSSMLEAVDPPKGAEKGVLHQILCVAEIAALRGEPSVRPTGQDREVAGEQLLLRHVVSVAQSSQQHTRIARGTGRSLGEIRFVVV